jgi:hypothetical protein
MVQQNRSTYTNSSASSTNNSDNDTRSGPSTRQPLISALAYARKGIPIFPCNRSDKRPYVAGGFHAATTDANQIREWWGSFPDAMIGIPTGPKSDLFVLDIDAGKDGPDALAELEREYGPLPETTRIRTGSGGFHYYFRHVAGYRCSANILGPGLDIRTGGGYVIAPPSRSIAGPYTTEERVKDRPEPPAWLLDKLRDGQGRVGPERTGGNGSTGQAGAARDAVAIEEDGPPIDQGGRNHGLTRVAGALKRRGAEGAELEESLHRINNRRCSPPLPFPEVNAIARSVDRYETGAPGPDARTLAEIDRLTRSNLDGREWRGVGGKSERSIYAAICQHGREWGRLIPGGVSVSISIRQLALKAATSERGVYRALNRLRENGDIRRESSRREGESGSIILVSPRGETPPNGPHGTPRTTRADCHHLATRVVTGRGGDTLRGVPLTAPRMRWSATGILRVGKSGEAVIDALEDMGGSATIEEVAAAVGSKRPRDLKRRIVSRLEERGIVMCLGDTISLENGWLGAIEAERECSGEVEKDRLDRAKFKRAGEAWRKKIAVNRAPSEADMERARDERPLLTGLALRAYNATVEPGTRAHRVWIANPTAEQLAGALAVQFAEYGRENANGWKRWTDPARQVLEVLDGSVGKTAA